VLGARRASADLRSVIGEGKLKPFSDAIAAAVARSFIVPSGSAPLAFRFDYDAGAFERIGELSANLYLDSPRPLGKGKFSFALSYQHFDVERFGGQDLDDLHDPVPFVDPATKVPVLSFQKVDIDLEVEQAVVSVTYGLSDRIDLNLVVPVLSNDASRTDTIHFVGDPTPTTGNADDTVGGIGDIQLRAKLQLVADGPVDVACGLGLRLPSGNEDDYQGTGMVDVTPSLVLATKDLQLGGGVAVHGVVNASMVLATEQVDQSEGRWALGVGANFGKQLAAEFAFLGRHAVSDLASPNAFDFERCVAGCQAGVRATRTASLPLFGFSGERPDYFDAVFGLRWSFWDGRLSAFASGLFPLSSEGLRTGPVPLVGLEALY
jgi:hypothetical protein